MRFTLDVSADFCQTPYQLNSNIVVYGHIKFFKTFQGKKRCGPLNTVQVYLQGHNKFTYKMKKIFYGLQNTTWRFKGPDSEKILWPSKHDTACLEGQIANQSA